MRRMRASTARGLAHGVWLATLVIWIIALILVFAIAPSDAIPMALLGLPMATYASVGALVARSSPCNLIGWLFSSVALALALWMFGSAYAQFGLGGASGIGDLPAAAAAAWTGAVALIAVLPIALPVFLLIFSDGHLRSRRWRPVAWVVALGGVLLVLGTIGQVWDFNPLLLTPPRWATRIPWIDQALQNAERHAPGAAAEVRLDPDGDGIWFVIHDEGPGFEVSTREASEGMQIMRDRIVALAGEIAIESLPGRGTTVAGRVPTRVMEASPA
jgi:hypothetical protein